MLFIKYINVIYIVAAQYMYCVYSRGAPRAMDGRVDLWKSFKFRDEILKKKFRAKANTRAYNNIIISLALCHIIMLL